MILNDNFKKVIEATAKQLQPLGLIRRGMVLRIMGQDNCGIVEFQRSTKSSKERLLFTINLGVVCGDLLDLGPAGLKKARIIDAHLWQRIGMFLPGRPDKWWEITVSTDSDALAREVADLVFEKAVPYIQRYLSTDSILTLWESGESPGLTNGQRANFLAMLKAKRQGGAA